MPTLPELDEALLHLSLVPHSRRLLGWHRRVDEILDARPNAVIDDLEEMLNADS